MRRGSLVVADANLRRIGYVCRNFKLTTAKMQTMTLKEATNLIFDVITKLAKTDLFIEDARISICKPS